MQREAIMAGRFYESKPDKLLSQIQECFRHPIGVGNNIPEISGNLVGMIVPHAGYMFSGSVASHAYARLQIEARTPDTILILGPKHTHHGAQFSISAASGWSTPLGMLEKDNDLYQMLCSEVGLLQADNDAHRFEHSIEVQLPFIQYCFKALPKILPIAIGYTSYSEIEEIATGIAKIIDNEPAGRVCILCSSDFSHEASREDAYKGDAEVIERITSFQAHDFYKMITEENRSVCGVMPITLLLLILRRRNIMAKLLKYSTSMDVISHDRGVGYAAITFEEC